jgi:Kef-type K+ transport system membrane component KefB/Trk K+ transport system NAD-binding subunit
MEHQYPFLPLLLITILAVVVPIVTSRIRAFKFPIVVGEILAGIVIGKTGLNLVQSGPTLNFLSQFGFAFLMFLSGLEINTQMLFPPSVKKGNRNRAAHPVFLSVTSFAAAVAMAVVIGFGLTWVGLSRNPVLMGLILSTTSLGIVVPILKERNLTPTLYGQVILLSALVSDFVTILLLSLTIGLISRGLSLDLLLFMALLAAFVAAARVSRWVSRIPLLTRLADELSHATAQIQVRGAFALMVVWVVLAQSLGTEIILGAFLAGAIMSAGGRGHESTLREKLDAIGYGFFVPVFFITVGADFDMRALLVSRSDILLVPILTISAYVVKVVPALLFRRLFSWRETLAAGVLLSSRLSMIIAAAAIALKLALITPATNSAIILIAVLTCTLSPLLFSRILPPAVGRERKGVIILGTDQLAVLLGQRLRHSGEPVTFIGRDQQRLGDLHQSGFAAVFGSPEDEQVLVRAGMANARALIAVSHSPDLVLAVCRLGQDHYRIPIVIARADDPQSAQQLQALNVRVVQPPLAVALALEGALYFPAAFAMLMDQEDDVEIVDVPLRNRELDGRLLRRVRLPGDALVLGIQRNGEFVVPHGDTVLRSGDTLVLVGRPEALREARGWLDPAGPFKSSM